MANNIYPNNINNLGVSDRINEFKETAIELLNKGISADELNDIIDFFIIDEQYEAAEGIKLAIDDFKK